MDTNFVGQMSIIVWNALFMSVRLSFFPSFSSMHWTNSHSNGLDFSLAQTILAGKKLAAKQNENKNCFILILLQPSTFIPNNFDVLIFTFSSCIQCDWSCDDFINMLLLCALHVRALIDIIFSFVLSLSLFLSLSHTRTHKHTHTVMNHQLIECLLTMRMFICFLLNHTKYGIQWWIDMKIFPQNNQFK